jgi:hypothetical protein
MSWENLLKRNNLSPKASPEEVLKALKERTDKIADPETSLTGPGPGTRPSQSGRAQPGTRPK